MDSQHGSASERCNPLLNTHDLLRTRPSAGRLGNSLRQLATGLIATLVTCLSCPAQWFDDKESQGTGEFRLEYDLTLSEVQDFVDDGYRITDLEVEQASPLILTCSLVANTGTYAQSLHYLTGVSAGTIVSEANARNMRPIDVESYDVGGVQRWAAVLIDNSSTLTQWWFWINTTSAWLENNATTNTARMIDIEHYQTGGNWYHAGVLVKNTGSVARTWELQQAVSFSTILSRRSSGFRVYDIEFDGSTYDAIMVQGSAQFFGAGASRTWIADNFDTSFQRVSDVDPMPNSSGYLITGLYN